MKFFLILLIITFSSCRTSKIESDKQTYQSLNKLKTDNKVITKQLPSINSYLFNLDDLTTSKTIKTPTDTNISIKKDSASNNLKITYETKLDTIYVDREVEVFVRDTIIQTDIQKEEVYIKNPLNWQIPLVLLIVIGILGLIIKFK